MEGTSGLFSAKLREMEREYGTMQRELRQLEAGREDGPRELERIWRAYQAQLTHLEQTARSCRTPAMAQMADLQREYEQKMEQMLRRSLTQAGAEGRAESAALYAEYAMDFAIQAMRYALMAALSAAQLEKSAYPSEAEGEKYDE